MDCEKVELHKAEKPWKSKRGATDDTDADINEEIVRQVRGTLNKLTMANYDSLIGKLIKLPFEDNEERFSSVDCLLFEKSINEPSFTRIYAKVVREVHVHLNSKETYYSIYREKIMDQCKIEFQKASTEKADIKEIEMTIEKTDDESKKESLMEELEERRTQMKARIFGNVRFIGEMYTLRTKRKMLTPNFMTDTVTSLLSMDEVNLECLCKLLTTVGFKLERKIKRIKYTNEHKRKNGQEIKFTPEPQWFDKTFNKIYELSKEESLSSRIRFALLDLYDLRQNNLMSRRRRGPNVPKTFPYNRLGQDAIRDFEKVELQHKAEKPWKPKRVAAETDTVSDNTITDTDVNEQLIRQARGILDKLTPHNFDTLVEEFLKLPLEDNEERIGSVVRLVIEKSINVPSFTAAYAKMVHTICKSSQETSEIFHKKILDQCQGIQKTSTDEPDINEIEKAIEKTDDKSKKESLKKELEDKRTQMKGRNLGNVRFIGELYNLQMLTPEIIIDRVTMLLSMDEENLECLCLLLTTVGLRLEEQIKDVENSNEQKRKEGQEIKFAPEPNWFDMTFNKLCDLSKEKSLSSRIRFALLDVHELRQNNWKTRQAIRQEQEDDRSTAWGNRPLPIPQTHMISQSQPSIGNNQQLGNRNINPRNMGMSSWMPLMIPQPPPRQPRQTNEPNLSPSYGDSRFEA